MPEPPAAMSPPGQPSLGAVLPQAEIRPSEPRDVRVFAERLERAGFGHLLVYDHILGADSTSRPGWTGYYDHTDPFLEPMVLFAFLGAATRLEFVTGVLVLPQRQTALLAKQAATLVDRAGINPLPVQRPIPIWIGCGDAPAALDRVGRLADGWIPHPNIGEGQRLAVAWRAVRAAAERAGRDPAAIGLQGQVRLRKSGTEGARAGLDRWAELGATHVAVNTLEAGLPWPDGHADACLEVLARWI
jgi:alkanesulfonate monooxygenase SsuD/methylene tetrahydromethanopterin reductase-like flavin-dependent oxidoreductase (luciferase family)